MSKKIVHPKQVSELPTPYHTSVMNEIVDPKQTDRGVGIIGAAYVDLVLREAITVLLNPKANITDLFENRGPLQDFGARIQMGFALGLYQRYAYNDLHTIKQIRNAFAHSAAFIDFNHSDVTRLCETLWYPKMIPYENCPNPTTPKELYIRAVELLTEGLQENIAYRKNGRPESSFLMKAPPKEAKKK